MKPKTKRSSRPDVISSLPAMGEYDPRHFLCCHSLLEGEKRKATKIWMCAFEPSLDKTGETGKMLATCGGNTVCFIDSLTGLVMKRFKDTDRAEDFYTLGWTTLKDDGKKINVLAVAGLSCTIKLIYPDQLVCYSTIKGHRKYISCLAFHPHCPSLLFSGSKDGSIMLWNIGTPGAEGTVNHSPVMKLKTSASVGDALCMAFSSSKNTLVAVTEKGFVGWSLGNVTVPSSSHRTRLVEQHSFSITLLKPGKSTKEVDSLVAMDNGLVATKCVGAEDILVWSLDDHLTSRGSKKQIQVIPLLRLTFPEVGVKYINMGYTNGVLSIGDDKGNIYLYNMKDIAESIPASLSAPLQPSQVLEWPDVDGLSEEETKEDVVMNIVVVSSDRSVVAGGTDNNLVCIWHRTQN
ncbi:leucine-rich repeat and WD repeat-containing protein 1-like [Babylonia areolata]|uniref:leucine-rich repeat and WD repeat-containing protein 1-like n=1 Tax=Babylonia areolata TaxID=304850 RepID=UPI003FD18FE9